MGEKPIRLTASGCDLPPASVYIVQFLVQADGTTGPIEFKSQQPPPCIREYISAVVADWVFEPGVEDGEPVALYYNMTVQTR